MSFLKEQEEYWLSELKKCEENPYYFFTTYVTVDNRPVETYLTEKEFNNLWKKWNNGK